MTVSGSVAQQSSGVLLNATPKDKSRRPDRSNAMSDSQFGCLTFSFDSWPPPYYSPTSAGILWRMWFCILQGDIPFAAARKRVRHAMRFLFSSKVRRSGVGCTG